MIIPCYFGYKNNSAVNSCVLPILPQRGKRKMRAENFHIEEVCSMLKIYLNFGL
jgi:hypothetical protein